MKKNGFTLIELLAVIVILAIIALIATPIVLDIIDDTKESAQLRSAENYIKAAEMAVAKKMMDDSTFKPTECSVEEGNLKCDGKNVEVASSGEKPSSGTLTFKEGSITGVELELNGKTIIREEGKLAFAEEGKIDENATDASCFEVEPIISRYEIGAGCDAYFQELSGEAELTCSGLVAENGDLLNLIKNLIQWGEMEKMSIEELEAAGIITNVEFTNNIEITNYTCGGYEGNENAIRDVIIPSKINGKSVTKIDTRAFLALDSEEEIIENKLINSIVIPNSVTSIEEYAFAHNELTSVELPNGITAIEDYTFGGNNLESIIIPDSVTSIGENAFARNALIDVVIPDKVTTIGAEAFEDCKSLKNARIGNSVTSLGYGVFMGCESLTSIIIPKSVTSISGGLIKESSDSVTINYMGSEEEWNLLSLSSSLGTSKYTIKYNYVIQ